jgi:acyl dehydratase
MSDNAAKAFELFQKAVGQEKGQGEWMEISQERINQFADVTEDHQFIHVDPERAKETPFGTTIAHGFLTLSLLVALDKGSTTPDPKRYEGMMMGVNYGFDKIRFINPVKVGSRIRASHVLSNAVLKGSAIDTTRSMTIEIEGEEKPALIADWITRVVYA